MTDTETVVDTESRIWRVTKRIGQILCGLRGHEHVRDFRGRNVSLRCVSCDHETPGWTTAGSVPRQRFEGDARRHVLIPAHLLPRKRA